MDMRFWWLVDRTEQGQFRIFWAPGILNLADYYTKKHPASHHKKVRPIYLYIKGKSPSLTQGCDKILTSKSTTCQHTDTHKHGLPVNPTPSSWHTDKPPGLIQDLHAKLRAATSHTNHRLPNVLFKMLASRLNAYLVSSTFYLS